jgi:tRNA A-37 threonylcarbamoyl transferase component Bud32
MRIGEIGREPFKGPDRLANGQLLEFELNWELEDIASYILEKGPLAKPLGHGAFGETLLYSGKAVKRIILKNDEAVNDFINEVGVWEDLARKPDLVPFIPKYLGSRIFHRYLDNNIDIGIIIQEYERVITLADFINISESDPFSGDYMYEIIMNIKRGYDLIHANGYIHRDIKPENILYRLENNDTVPIIIDFGLVCKKPCIDTYLAGTLLYQPLNALRPQIRDRIGQRTFPVYKKKGFFDKLFKRKDVIKKIIKEKIQMNEIDPIYNDAWDNYSVSLVIAKMYDVTNWTGSEEKKVEIENLINRLSSQIIPFLAAKKRRINLLHAADAEKKKGNVNLALNLFSVIPNENSVLRAELGPSAVAAGAAAAASAAAGGSRLKTRRHRHKGHVRGRSLKGGR